MTRARRDSRTQYRVGEDVIMPVYQGARIYAGTLVCVNAEGYAVPADDHAGYRFVGVAKEQSDNRQGASGDRTVRLGATGTYRVAVQGLSQADIMKPMYIIDDLTIAADTVNSVRCGVLEEYESAAFGWLRLAIVGAAGDSVVGIAGEELAAFSLCYLGSDGKYYNADASAAGTMPGVVMCREAISQDAEGQFQRRGDCENPLWTWTTVGLLLYASTSPGCISDTPPIASGAQIQIVGQVLSATTIHLSPQLVTIELA